MASAAQDWAWDEFGRAEIRDLRRKKRLLRMASDAVQHPSGRVSESIRCPRALAGAYDLLESLGASSEALLKSMALATADRCSTHDYVIVPVDGSSLSLQGKVRGRAFGALGAHRQGGRGLKVMTALTVSPDGTPLGLCSQRWWIRKQDSRLRDSKKRSLVEKESRFWLEAIDQTRQVLQGRRSARPWFQLDREGDSLSIIAESVRRGELLTARSRHNRRLRIPGQPLKRWRSAGAPLLYSELDRQPPLGVMPVVLKSRETGVERTAQVEIRAMRVVGVPRGHTKNRPNQTGGVGGGHGREVGPQAQK